MRVFVDVCVSVCISQSSPDEQSEVLARGGGRMRGWGEGDYGSLLWPEMALAAQGLEGVLWWC